MTESPFKAFIRSQTLQDFADVIGETAALRLSARFGGQMVHLPKTPRRNSDLAQAIGYETACKLCRRYGGLQYTIPLTAGKRARVIEMRRQTNRSAVDIARELGSSVRFVHKVTKEFCDAGGSLQPTGESELRGLAVLPSRKKRPKAPPPPSRQKDLFD